MPATKERPVNLAGFIERRFRNSASNSAAVRPEFRYDCCIRQN
jgi:hypothetical protein